MTVLGAGGVGWRPSVSRNAEGIPPRRVDKPISLRQSPRQKPRHSP